MEPADHMNDRLRAGWAAATATPDVFARIFYGRLFASDANIHHLFGEDLQAQGRKLEDTMSFIIDHLDNETVLLAAAKDLALRHVAYGVTPDHYTLVGAALIATLEELLGAEFTDADRAAWGSVYSVLSQHMISAAYETQ